jgi:hypothetical protein
MFNKIRQHIKDIKVIERAKDCSGKVFGSQKRKYGSYALIVIGFGGVIEHLLTTGFSWDLATQDITCHGFYLGILPLLVGIAMSVRWKK